MPGMASCRSGSKTALPWTRRVPRRFLASILVIIGLQGCVSEETTEPKSDIKTVNSSLNLVDGLHDNFTDADGTLLENHTPDGGTVPFSWLRSTVWGAPAEIQDSALTAAPGGDWAYLTSVHAGDQAELKVEVLGVPQPGEWQEIAIYFRTQNADVAEGYFSPLWSLGSDSSYLTVQAPRTFGGIIQRSGPVSVGVHTLRAEINSSGELEVHLDGAFVGKAPLGPLPPPGRIGIATWTTAAPVARLTSFSAAPGQALNVTCLPAAVIRGDSIHCKSSLTFAEPYTVIRRTAKSSELTVTDLTSESHQAGDTNVWAGPAVSTSDVTVEVRLTNGQTLTNQTPARFEVQARNWAVWKLATLRGPLIKVEAPWMIEYPQPDTGNFGLFFIDWQKFDDPVATPTIRTTGGPNKGLVYLRDNLKVAGYTVYTHPAMYPPTKTTPEGSKIWYKDQNGRGSGTCTSSNIAFLASEVERHEGTTKADNSHFGVANDQFALLQPQLLLEKQFSQADESTFRQQVFDTLGAFLNTGPYDAAHNRFDATDVPRVMAALGCTLDYNPNSNDR